MPEPDSSSDRIVEAAWLYHEAGLNQREIASRLHVSRATVIRWLQLAREQGVVQIRITKPLGRSARVALQLEDRYKDTTIRRVIVADSDGKAAAGVAATRFLSTLLKPADVLGVAWSSTLAQIDESVTPTNVPSRVLQLVGSVGSEQTADGYETTLRLARAWDVKASTIPAPVMAPDVETARLLLSDPVVADAFSRFSACTVALVGVGTVSTDSTMISTGYLTERDTLMAQQLGAVGDVLGRYFDIAGDEVLVPWLDRLVGASLDDLRAIDNVILVAAGTTKAEAVNGAIEAGLATTLIVDRALAATLNT